VQDAALALVFGGTILALYLRPFGARDWQVAAVGAALAWLIGPLGFRGGIEAIADSANIVAFFFGLMVIAAGAEAAGLYARAAGLIRRGRSGTSQVIIVLVLGTAITAVLSNDATPLVLTPAILAAGVVGSKTTRSAALAATFTADGASLLLPVSNPVNLLSFERFEMSFGDYLANITPAAAAGIAAMGIVVWWQQRRPALLEERPLSAVPAHDIRWPAAAVVVLVCGYVLGGLAGVPLGLITLGGGALMLAAARASGPVEAKNVRHHIAPGVLVFVCALLLLVESVSTAGLLGPLSEMLEGLAEQPELVTIVGSALLAAILANLLNNWPSALLLASAIEGLAGPIDGLVAGALIGSAIGANFTTIGSLSTVFWLSLARQRGLTLGPIEYARSAFAPTLAALMVACLVATLLV
jgi:arsenical pump membrane protein